MERLKVDDAHAGASPKFTRDIVKPRQRRPIEDGPLRRLLVVEGGIRWRCQRPARGAAAASNAERGAASASSAARTTIATLPWETESCKRRSQGPLHAFVFLGPLCLPKNAGRSPFLLPHCYTHPPQPGPRKELDTPAKSMTNPLRDEPSTSFAQCRLDAPWVENRRQNRFGGHSENALNEC